ncbi:MAG: response regulator [Terriglobia bacterium]
MPTFKPKILVVEDDPAMLGLLGEVLSRSGAEPRCLSSSQEAAELINREKFDAVFLDWRMPEMSGVELTERIRWSKSNSRCPIIMVTGITEPTALKECFRAGVNFFLQKPVSVQDIRRLLNSSRGMIMQERRRYQRAPVQTPVVCEWEMQSFKQKTSGVSVNLSASGILVKLEATPPTGTLVYLSFTLPEDSERFALSASVVRVTPDRNVGLGFHGLTENQRHRLMEFIDRVINDSREERRQRAPLSGPRA